MDTGYIIIPLTLGYETLIDKEDFSLVSRYKWHTHRGTRGTVYARGIVEGRRVFLHSFLTGWTLTDHRNLDTLDNRRGNLRKATPSENMANRTSRKNSSSKYKGVSYGPNSDGTKPWRVRIQYQGRQYHLGRFVSEREAALKYNKVALEMFGEFALLNRLD